MDTGLEFGKLVRREDDAWELKSRERGEDGIIDEGKKAGELRKLALSQMGVLSLYVYASCPLQIMVFHLKW